MILAQHGIDIPESTLAEQADKQVGGVDIEKLPALARMYGLRAEIVQLDIEAIAEWINQDVFPIVYLNRVYFEKKGLLERKSALGSAIVHAVIPIRLSAHFVTLRDPRHGKRRRVSKKRFKAVQRDLRHWCVVFRT
jgi:ABC-type bacteriocin/lantibiotic exporter with double-glycine peptidase domain